MKAEQYLDIPEKREAIVPVEADATRFAVWRVARERWGPAFLYRSPRADTLFCGLVLSGTLEQSDGGPNTVEVRAGEVVLCGAGGPRSHIVRDPEGVELLMWVALSGLATAMARSLFPSLPTAFAVRRVRAMESLFIRLLGEVAHALGWADPYAFSRSFKRVMGMPPSQMLRRRRPTGRATDDLRI